MADTVKAGAGLVDENIARILAEESKARVNDLIAFGVPFDRMPDGQLKLGREAAHSRNRIVGVSGDRAGREIMSALAEEPRKVRQSENLSDTAPMNLPKTAAWSASSPARSTHRGRSARC